MRVRSSLALAAVLTLTAGCTINLPNNLIQALSTSGRQADNGKTTKTDGTQPPPVEAQKVRADEPPPTRETAPCDKVFQAYDRDKNGGWSFEEWVGYGRTVKEPVLLCAVPPTPPTLAPVAPAIAPVDGRTTDVKPAPPMPLPEACQDKDFVYTFKQFDFNHDEQLDPKEACGAIDALAGMGPTPGPQLSSPPEGNPPPLPPKPCDETFFKRDMNRDGLLAWEEFYSPDPSLPPERASEDKDKQYQMFKMRDLNGDQRISPEESCKFQDQPPPPPPTEQPPTVNNDCMTNYKVWDRNADGALSIEEYVEGRWSQINFIKAPTDEEVRRMKDNFAVEGKKLDANLDAKLTPEEYAKGCPQ